MDEKNTSDGIIETVGSGDDDLVGVDATNNQEPVEIIPPDKQEPTRNELGHWVKGSSGNPNGRPHKPSITIMIQNELEKVEPNSKKTWLQLIVARLLQMAVIEGDTNILKTIWNYVDGMPRFIAEVKETSESDEAMDVLGEIIKERRQLTSGNDKTPVSDIQD